MNQLDPRRIGKITASRLAKLAATSRGSRSWDNIVVEIAQERLTGQEAQNFVNAAMKAGAAAHAQFESKMLAGEIGLEFFKPQKAEVFIAGDVPATLDLLGECNGKRAVLEYKHPQRVHNIHSYFDKYGYLHQLVWQMHMAKAEIGIACLEAAEAAGEIFHFTIESQSAPYASTLAECKKIIEKAEKDITLAALGGEMGGTSAPEPAPAKDSSCEDSLGSLLELVAVVRVGDRGALEQIGEELVRLKQAQEKADANFETARAALIDRLGKKVNDNIALGKHCTLALRQTREVDIDAHNVPAEFCSPDKKLIRAQLAKGSLPFARLKPASISFMLRVNSGGSEEGSE